MNLVSFSRTYLPEFNHYLMSVCTNETTDSKLVESMTYSLSNGGKRIRPLLLLAVLKAFNRDVTIGFSAAAAVEMIHTYSLIHDDLPAMDDDDYRRGKLTNHKQFDESTAILAGDALLTEAFAIIANDEALTSEQKVHFISALSRSAGMQGMVNGQIKDIQSEGKTLDLESLQHIHQQKTGALIHFALTTGALLSDVSETVSQEIEVFAHHYGIAYQIQNDLQEVLWDDEQTGKKQSGDQIHEKNTYPSLLSVSGAQSQLAQHIECCEEKLRAIESQVDAFDGVLLIEFLNYLRI